MLTDVEQISLRGNRIIIKEADKEIKANGVIISGGEKESSFLFSEVVSIGDGVSSVKPGDLIMHSIRTGSLVRIGSKYYAVITEPEIVATINLENK